MGLLHLFQLVKSSDAYQCIAAVNIYMVNVVKDTKMSCVLKGF